MFNPAAVTLFNGRHRGARCGVPERLPEGPPGARLRAILLVPIMLAALAPAVILGLGGHNVDDSDASRAGSRRDAVGRSRPRGGNPHADPAAMVRPVATATLTMRDSFADVLEPRGTGGEPGIRGRAERDRKGKENPRWNRQ